MSDSDEILFDDIYELHEVIGKILEFWFEFGKYLQLDDFRTLEEFRSEFLIKMQQTPLEICLECANTSDDFGFLQEFRSEFRMEMQLTHQMTAKFFCNHVR